MVIRKWMLKATIMHLNFQAKRARKRALLPDMSKAKLDIKPEPESSFEQCYDVFYADNPNGMTIVDIHGGAYVYSNRQNNHAFARNFLDRGFNFVVLDYRRNLGKIDPQDQVKDIAKATKHLFEHAKELGLDPDRIVVTGDSAGGHFALLLAEMTICEDVALPFGVDLSSCHFRAVALNCPVYDFLSLSKLTNISKSAKKYMVGPHFEDVEYHRPVDPRTHFPNFTLPLLVSTCKHDFIRKHAEWLHEDAVRYGVDHTFLDIDDDTKGVEHIHNVINFDLEASKQVNDAMAEFFLSHDVKK